MSSESLRLDLYAFLPGQRTGIRIPISLALTDADAASLPGKQITGISVESGLRSADIQEGLIASCGHHLVISCRLIDGVDMAPVLASGKTGP